MARWDSLRGPLQEAPAEWMLTPPGMAMAWNAMYERVYPGVLQAFTGLDAGELFVADRWAAALLPSAQVPTRGWVASP